MKAQTKRKVSKPASSRTRKIMFPITHLEIISEARKRQRAGIARSNRIRRISTQKKGSTPRKILLVGVWGEKLLITKTFKPTGGVINPSSTTTKAKIPNHSFRLSVFIPKKAVSATAYSPPFSSIKMGKRRE